ncbi:retinoblastoma-like protein 1 isoform X2 [Diabrotica virgifera virgifera]|uniref:Retinoblastoma-like protein 1 n=1 Tax=Diabrotica virgifera virgifera TaxID=50390 RepID=A0ABM5KL53_DIAVI|nr:retinoblastoma-like protein 1 isoform X2 [Diabrotica virgifera virgifera]
MVLSDEGEDQLHKKLLDLCGKLSLDQRTVMLAWDNFISINKNFTLEGDSLHWLGCAIFVASQSLEVPNLMSSVVRGSGINLTSLLRCSNLSFVQFFTNINLWADMAHLPEEFRQKVKHLQDTFGVAHSTFKKYYPIFCQIFQPPNSADLENAKQHRNRKLKPIMCNSSTVFEFVWSLFVTLKSEDQQFGSELVKSYHLMFACIDLAFKNAFLAERRDLLKPNFELLPTDWNEPGFVVPQEAPCLMSYLCKLPSTLTEAMHMKVYDLKKLMGNLITNDILKVDPKDFTGLFDQDTFKDNFKNIKTAYETHLLNTADIDERIFLAEYRRLLLVQQQQATWGQSVRASPLSYSENSVITSPQNNENNGGVTPRAPDTPLTGRGYLPRESDSSPLSADRTITQKIARLHKIVNNRPQGPSEALLKLLESGEENTIDKIQEILNSLSDKFVVAYSSKYSGREEEAKNMLQIGVTLFYKYVENLLDNESKIRNDISALVKKDIFYKCMFSCCMEIVLFSYNFPNKFPWILDVFEVQPIHFVKVIELIVRTKDQLSREMVKHLNMTEETVLESLMWKSNSPIWEAIALSGGSIPKFEETALPNQVVYDRNGLRNESNDIPTLINIHQSPVPSAVDRFQSPIQNASRNLFPNIQPGQSVLQKNPQLIIVDKEGNKKWISFADVDNKQQPAPENVRRRLGSLAIIFRKFYVLAGIRMEHLCMKLNLVDTEVKKKIWTQFEYSIQNSDLIKDRHLDQLLMCAVYVISRLSDVPLKFQDIMKFYREQPQCNSNVYRNVLITRECIDDESGRRCPEERSDLIIFYNSVYVGVMQKFAVKFRSSVQTSNLLLSPLPAVKSKSLISSSVQVVGNVFLRPFEIPVASSSTNFNYFFSRSPSKDLKDINKLVSNSKVTGKRLLADDLEAESPPKRLSDRKFHTLVEERRNQNSE